MAISLKDANAWAFATGNISVTMTGIDEAAGDMLIARVAYKSSSIATDSAETTAEGWAKLGEFHDGTTNSGNGTGSVAVAVFWKEATSSTEPSPAITMTAATQTGAVMMCYQKGAGETWETPVGDGGGDTSAGVSHSATIQSHVSVTAGDMVDFFTGIRDDTTMTVPTITQSGVTFDTVSEQPDTAGSDTSGADGAYDGGYRLATAGTSSAAAVVTGTLSTNETGASWMTRLRVVTAAERVPYFSIYPQILPQ